MGAAVAGCLAAAAPAAQAASARHGRAPSWKLLDPGVQSHFRGLSPVSRKVAWLGGYNGLVLRTVNGGRTWLGASPAGASTLQFRDISAFDATHAVAMAAGPGPDSRLYFTADGGRSWRLAYQNTDPAAFFDCMSFFDRRHGLVLSDPVGGKFRILSTRDGGNSWTVLPNAGMPAALPGEAGFAASGECLTTSGRGAWFGSGGGAAARIFHSRDGGLTWDVATTPVTSGPTAGVFGLAFRAHAAGVAVGGDFSAPTASSHVSAVSVAGGPWISPPSGPAGYRSGVTWVPHTRATVIAVGLTGSDISNDGGLHWRTFDTGQFDTVSCASDGACWASGDLGRVAVLNR
jgi:photosystem II stability/assembly factor-like uncharacterized protein